MTWGGGGNFNQSDGDSFQAKQYLLKLRIKLYLHWAKTLNKSKMFEEVPQTYIGGLLY